MIFFSFPLSLVFLPLFLPRGYRENSEEERSMCHYKGDSERDRAKGIESRVTNDADVRGRKQGANIRRTSSRPCPCTAATSARRLG
ncbi:hypothetical protein GGR56DRAFT_640721 [Xylariaceae sp. FL0804]|nr:hypothetical protein GGR56DRAFT_640721 [Xylariaceae sp. FL0804]